MKTFWLEAILYFIVAILAFIVITLVFRGLQYEAVYKWVDNNGQETEMTYNLPSLIGPNQGELLTEGTMEALVEVPAVIDAGKLNTVIWSAATGLLLYLILRLVFRKRISAALQPLTKNMKLDLVDEIGYRSVAIEAETIGNQNSAVESGQDSIDENESVEDTKIKLIFDNKEVIVNMYDNPMSRDFLTMLPITSTFEDFNGEEKISYLPRKLNSDSTPSNSGTSAGEFAYYAPWGNLAIFYNGPVTTSNGVIVLGEFESGIEDLASMSDDFTVTIEKMD